MGRTKTFLFQNLDSVAVAWFRIAFAITIPWFFRSSGLEPMDCIPESLRAIYGQIFLSPSYYLCVVGLCVLLGCGWRPKFCSRILFLLLTPLDLLNGSSLSRQVMLFALFAFSFIPSSNVRFPWIRPGKDVSLSAGPCWPIRLIQIQLTVLYGINAIAKSSPMYLHGYTLMDMSVSYPNFLVDMSNGYMTLGLITIPVALAGILSTLTEYTLALGFWSKRLKWFVAAIGVAFHLMLQQVVQIFMLGYVSMFLYLAFLLPLIKADENPHTRVRETYPE